MNDSTYYKYSNKLHKRPSFCKNNSTFEGETNMPCTESSSMYSGEERIAKLRG